MTVARPTDNDDLSHISADLRPLAVAIGSIHPDPDNIRIDHAVDETAESLEAHGQRKPLVVNASEGNKIEAGNGTYKSARQLGWEWVAVSFVNDTPEQATAYAIADNRTGDMSTFDPIKLGAALEALPSELATGFGEVALNNALALATMANPEKVEFPEYKEKIVETVKYIDCPNCGHAFPK